MRLSYIILKFYLENYFLLIAAILTGLMLLLFTYKSSYFKINIKKTSQNFKILNIFILLISIIFIWWGYLTKAGFYTPYNTGNQGDNFHFISQAIENPNYYFARHLAFPWLGAKAILIAIKLGVLNVSDKLFRFHAAEISSLPVRLLSVLGFIYLYKVFNILMSSFSRRMLSVLFFASTFSYWLWSIQPNALAIAFVFQIISIYYSIRLLIYKNIKSAILAAVFLSLTVYAHISSIYFVVAVASFLASILIRNCSKKEQDSSLKLLLFVFSLLIMGSIFFLLTVQYSGGIENFSIESYFNTMIDLSYLGPFKLLNFKGIILNSITNLALTSMNIVGFLVGEDFFDYGLIYFILTLSCACLTYIFINLKKIYKSINAVEKQIFLMLFLAITIPFVCFLFRNNGSHYYAISLIPNALMFIYLIYKIDEKRKICLGAFFVSTLTVFLFLFNGFSSRNVLKGLDFKSSAAFNKLEALSRNFTDKEIYFFETYNSYLEPFKKINNKKIFFFEDSLTTEYSLSAFLDCFNSSFPNIKWLYHFDYQTVKQILNKQNQVVIGSKTYAQIANQLPNNITIESLKDFKTNEVFYKLSLNEK